MIGITARDRKVQRVGWSSCLLAFVVLVSACADQPETIHPVIERMPRLQLLKRVGELVEPLLDGETVAEGDVIQIVYVSPGPGYGAIFSIDGRDSLLLHRAEKGVSFKLRSGSSDTLRSAYQLDDAPGFERFYLITSEQPFHVRPLLKQALQATPGLPKLSKRYRLDTSTLKKQQAP